MERSYKGLETGLLNTRYDVMQSHRTQLISDHPHNSRLLPARLEPISAMFCELPREK